MGNTQLWVPVEPKPFDRSTWNLTWVMKSAVWPHMPKIVKVGPAGPPRHMGEISCSSVYFYLFYIFLMTSCAALENTFLGISPQFLCQTTWFGEDWFSRGVITSTPKFFPTQTPKNLKFWTRFIMGRLINKLPLIVTAAPWKLQSE